MPDMQTDPGLEERFDHLPTNERQRPHPTQAMMHTQQATQYQLICTHTKSRIMYASHHAKSVNNLLVSNIGVQLSKRARVQEAARLRKRQQQQHRWYHHTIFPCELVSFRECPLSPALLLGGVLAPEAEYCED